MAHNPINQFQDSVAAVDDFSDKTGVKQLEESSEYGKEGTQLPPSGRDGFHYPQKLSEMTDAPSQDAVLRGLDLQDQELKQSAWSAISTDYRIVLYSLPFLISCLGTGFDNGAANITQSMPAFFIKFGEFDPVIHRPAIPSVWISLWSALFQLGVVLGSFATTFLLDRFGPRKVSFLTSIYAIGPILIQVFTPTRGVLLLGKILVGLALGVWTIAAANWIAESSSARLRATLSASVGMTSILGILLGILAGSRVILVFNDWGSWRLVLALQLVFPVVTAIGLIFSPTSPIYSVKQGRPAEAYKILRKLRPYESEEDSRSRLAAIMYAVALELEEREAQGKISYFDLLKDPVERKRTLLCCGIFTGFQAGGTTFLGQGLYFLVQQGVPIGQATDITLGCLGISCAAFLVAGGLMDKLGRRFMYVYFNVLHLGVMAVIGFIGFKSGSTAAGWALAVLMNIAITTQNLATGASAYALTAEIPSVRLRAKTQSLAITTNYIWSFAGTMAVPYIFQNPGYLGAKTSLIFAGLTALTLVWSFFSIPETKGRTPEEIDALFRSGIPRRKFKQADVAAITAKHAAELP